MAIKFRNYGKEEGAKFIIVGSGQQFYYSIGFRPFSTSTVWQVKIGNN